MGTVTARVDDDTIERLETLAKETERSKSWLVADALRRYLAANAWQIEAVAEALAETRDETAKPTQSAKPPADVGPAEPVQATDKAMTDHGGIRAAWEAKIARALDDQR